MPIDYSSYDEYFKSKEYISQDIKNIRDLVNLTDEQLESLILDMNMSIKKDDVYKLIPSKDKADMDERIIKLLELFAKKYCRCIKNIQDKYKDSKDSKESNIYNPYAVCTSSIFNKRGLKGIGKSVQCEKFPMLLLPKNSKNIIEYK